MNSIDISDGLESLPLRAIALTDEQIDQARQRSQTIDDPTLQWQIYLNTLALLGFEQWLNQRANDISINSTQNSILQSTEMLPVVSNIIINDFKVCLIPVESQPDEVELPSIAVTSSELAAHFYVTVAVYEEQSQVAVHSFLRYDQLSAQLRSLQPDSGHLYNLSISRFEPNLDRLLLYLRCSQPAAIPLPSTHTPHRSAERSRRSPTPHTPSINVRRWLQNELDELAQQLSWVLLPPLALENVMRVTAKVVNQPTPQESFEGVIKQLMRDGMTLPVNARVAYQDLNIGRVNARLHAIAGTLPTNDHPPEWTLLLILGPRSRTPLPPDTQLQISESDTILVQQTLTQQNNYLYAKVIGTLDEQFRVTIRVPEHETIRLPAFSY